ncbi:MAG: hypothetical protein JXD23_03295 [Spirochaetales bacterium]|nr:hypothetical protein [Spirochaetales bacterium]
MTAFIYKKMIAEVKDYFKSFIFSHPRHLRHTCIHFLLFSWFPPSLEASLRDTWLPAFPLFSVFSSPGACPESFGRLSKLSHNRQQHVTPSLSRGA